jgi:hypothetical protein
MTVGLLARNEVYRLAKRYVTFYYETSKYEPDCYGVTAGNFDGAGLSHGIIQFNFKSGTIQPIWKDLINQYPDVCKNAFNNNLTDYNKWVDVVFNYTTTNQIAWADSITVFSYDANGNKIQSSGRKLKEPWNSYFTALGKTPESIARQDKGVQPYLDLGESWKKKYSLWSRRGFLLCFDIAVQSGGLGATVEANIQADINALNPNNYTKEAYETEKMRIIATRKSEDPNIGAEWRQSYKDRKLAIANGSGVVYGSPTDTVPYDMILEPAFDYDVDWPPFQPFRYVRDWLNGSTANLNNYWNEIKVISTTGANLAQGKPVTSNGTLTNAVNITDNSNTTYAYETSNTGAKYAQVDLGALVDNVDSIQVYHYYLDSRTFSGTKVEISVDGVTWYPLRDSTVHGTYMESSAGLTLLSNSDPRETVVEEPPPVTPTEPLPAFQSFRYIRDWLNGNSVNPYNYWNEIKVMVGATNIAQGLPITTNGTITNAIRITDGDKTNYAYETANTGPKYVQIDLGSERADVDTIQVFHFYADGRTFNGTKTEISVDGINWTPLRDSAFQGVYQETVDGLSLVPDVIPSSEDEPKVSIIGLSLPKLSDEVGFQSAIITFQFNVDVDMYTVRCTGIDHTTGTDAETGSKTVEAQAVEYTVEEASALTVSGMTVFPAYTDITAEIDYTELYTEGVNRINIYGRNLSGVWTSYES